MALLIPLVGLIVLILAANWIEASKNELYRRLFDGFMIIVNIPFLLLGGLFLALPAEGTTALQGDVVLPFEDLWAAGILFLAMGAWGTAVTLRSVRNLLGRLLPLNPKSAVHMLGLLLSGYLVGNTILTLTQGGLVELAANAEAASVYDVVLQNLLFVIVALFGVGLFTRRGSYEINERLGLVRPARRHLILALRWMVTLVMVQWVLGAIWFATNPEQAELVDSVSGQLLSDFDSVWEWFALALSAGLGEEILFRGAMQPALGMIFTSVVFAIAHVQYGITPVTLSIFIISLALGYIRFRTNTTVAVIVHFGYNFILGLMALAAMQMESLVN